MILNVTFKKAMHINRQKFNFDHEEKENKILWSLIGSHDK